MENKYEFIKEVFEKYGFVDLDTVDPEDKDFRKFVKENFITMKKLKPGPGAFDEIRYTGTYTSLLKMLERYFDEDSSFLDEYFEKK